MLYEVAAANLMKMRPQIPRINTDQTDNI